jgi:hypothetical protein
MRPAGGNHSLLRKYVDEIWRIPTGHFDAAGSSIRNLHRPPVPLAEVLVEGSTYSRGKLKERLFSEGLKERRCEQCDRGELWRGRPMSLILDGPAMRECKRCGKQFTAKYRTHMYCSRTCGVRWDRASLRGQPHLGQRKVARPSYRQLLDEIEATGFVAVGCKYGVSDNAVRKWVRFYERQMEREAAEDQAVAELG